MGEVVVDVDSANPGPLLEAPLEVLETPQCFTGACGGYADMARGSHRRQGVANIVLPDEVPGYLPHRPPPMPANAHLSVSGFRANCSAQG